MSNKRSILVVSPSHKCVIDFKVRGRLGERQVKTIKFALGSEPVLAVRVGNVWHPVSEISEHAPLRMVVPMSLKVPGLR